MRLNFVVPFLMGVAFLLLGYALPLLVPDLTGIWKLTLPVSAALLGVALLFYAFFVARRSPPTPKGQGGNAGTGIGSGDYSDAEGGAGGKANGGIGGHGGHAVASGKGARAKGGAGGSG